MRLTSFSVKGFKNFREEVTLEGLSAINILHGENNVGKSNLMEALLLALELWDVGLEPEGFSTPDQKLLGYPPVVSSTPSAAKRKAEGVQGPAYGGQRADPLQRADPSPRVENPEPLPIRWFYRQGDQPIRFRLRFEFENTLAWMEVPPDARFDGLDMEVPDEGDYERAALHLSVSRDQFKSLQMPEHTLAPLAGMEVRLELMPQQRTFERVCKFWLKGADAPQPFSVKSLKLLKPLFSEVKATLLRADRQGNREPIAQRRYLERQVILSQETCLELLDAESSTEKEIHAQWQLFVDLMKQFQPTTRMDELSVHFDRREQRAFLAFKGGGQRYLLQDLGTGVQQLAALMAHIALNKAPILLLEEPELNLRYDLQVQLRELLQKLVTLEGGPRQLFVTSHSPAFETGEDFYLLEQQGDVPCITRRPVAERFKATHMEGLAQLLPNRPGVNAAYVTRDGLVRLPPRILHALGLESGGGINFLINKQSGYVELLSDLQVDQLFDEPDEPDEPDAQEDEEEVSS